MLEYDDFSMFFNILPTRSVAEAVMGGVRCAALALHKADWLVAVLSVPEGSTLVVVDVVTRMQHTDDVVRKT